MSPQAARRSLPPPHVAMFETHLGSRPAPGFAFRSAGHVCLLAVVAQHRPRAGAARRAARTDPLVHPHVVVAAAARLLGDLQRPPACACRSRARPARTDVPAVLGADMRKEPAGRLDLETKRADSTHIAALPAVAWRATRTNVGFPPAPIGLQRERSDLHPDALVRECPKRAGNSTDATERPRLCRPRAAVAAIRRHRGGTR
jgi:hypothetical protein